jgi:hypothetical protein
MIVLSSMLMPPKRESRLGIDFAVKVGHVLGRLPESWILKLLRGVPALLCQELGMGQRIVQIEHFLSESKKSPRKQYFQRGLHYASAA